jgi:hypothetical protein
VEGAGGMMPPKKYTSDPIATDEWPQRPVIGMPVTLGLAQRLPAAHNTYTYGS